MINTKKVFEIWQNVYFVAQLVAAVFFNGVMVYGLIMNITNDSYSILPQCHIENVVSYIAMWLWITGTARIFRMIRTHFHTRKVMREVFPEMVRGK